MALPNVGDTGWGTTLNSWLLTGHNSDGSHDADDVAFTPTGTIAATTVQGAIAEVASEGGAGADSASTTLNGGLSIGATSVIVTAVPANLKVGGLVAIGPWTTNCEVRRVTAISGSTLTVAALKVAHTSGDRILATSGFWLPPELYGAVADNSAVDSYRALINMFMDQTDDWGVMGQGLYYSSCPLFVTDYARIDIRLRAFVPFAIDCTIGEWNGIPNQYFFILNSSTATCTFNAAANTVTFSVTPGSAADKRVAFYPRPGSTMPGGIEEGRHYFTTAGGVGPVSLRQSQGGGTVDITSVGSGEIICVSPGLARLIGRVDLHGAKVKGLNGALLICQQPSEATMRIEQFPVVGATIAANQCSFPNFEVIDCWIGLEHAGAQMVWMPRADIEGCDFNMVVAESERWILTGGTNNSCIVGPGLHWEAAGQGVTQIQTLIPSATLTGGTFQLRFKNVLTSAINFNSTAAQLQTILEAHAAIGAGNVTCTQMTGTNLSDGRIQCDFTVGTLQWELWVGSTDTSTGGQMVVSGSSLTGGTVSVNLVNPAGRCISFREGFGYEFNNNYYGSAGTYPDGTKVPFLQADGTAVGGSGWNQGYIIRALTAGAQSLPLVSDALTGDVISSSDSSATGSAEYLAEYIRPARHGGTIGRHWHHVGQSGRKVAINTSGAPTLELTAASGQTDALLAVLGTSSFIEIDERSTDPAAPAVNKARLYIKDVAGKTGLFARFPTGAVQQISIEP